MKRQKQSDPSAVRGMIGIPVQFKRTGVSETREGHSSTLHDRAPSCEGLTDNGVFHGILE